MNAVVEQGVARCPRCMSVADYRFLEPAGGDLSYEVRCGSCGNIYVETCGALHSHAG
ncbi:MAG: hypothetical protein ACSLE6_06590 [Mycobacterium sp.]